MLYDSGHVDVYNDHSALHSWVKDKTKPDDLIILQCRVMIDLLDEEQFYGIDTWGAWYQRLVKAYCALEDEENARRWAEKAVKLATVYTAVDVGWDAVAQDPKRTDWWGRRAGSRSGILLVENMEDAEARRGAVDMKRLRVEGPKAFGSVIKLKT